MSGDYQPHHRSTLKSLLHQQQTDKHHVTLPPSQYLRQGSARRHSPRDHPSDSTSSAAWLPPVDTPSPTQRATTANPRNRPKPQRSNHQAEVQSARRPNGGDLSTAPQFFQGPYMQRLSSAPPTRTATNSSASPLQPSPPRQQTIHVPASVAADPSIEGQQTRPATTTTTTLVPREPGPQVPPRANPAPQRVGLNLSPRGVTNEQPSALTEILRDANRILELYETLRLTFTADEQLELARLAIHCGLASGSESSSDAGDEGNAAADIRLGALSSREEGTPPPPPPLLPVNVRHTEARGPLEDDHHHHRDHSAPDHSPGDISVVAVAGNLGSVRSSLSGSSFDVTSGVPLSMCLALANMRNEDVDAAQLFHDLATTYIPHCAALEMYRLLNVGETKLLVSSRQKRAIDLSKASSRATLEFERVLLMGSMIESATDLYVPIQSGGCAMGVLHLLRSANAPAPLLDDERARVAVEVLGAYAASHIRELDIVESLTRQKLQSEGMLRMTHLLAHDALDQQRLMHDIMETVKQLTEADRCAIFQPVENSDDTVEFVATVEGGKQIRAPTEGSIVGRVARTLKAVRVDDVDSCSDFYRGADRTTGYTTRNVLCAPVMCDGHLVAVAQLVNKTPIDVEGVTVERNFTIDDEAVLAMFGTFVGLSLRNCRQNAQLVQEKCKVERLFNALSTIVGSDIVDVPAVSSAIENSAKIICGTSVDVGCAVFIVDRESSQLKCRCDGHDQSFECVGIVGSVVCDRQTVVLQTPEAIAASAFVPSVDAPSPSGAVGVQALISIPITFSQTDPRLGGNGVQEDLVGVLQLFTRETLEASFAGLYDRVFSPDVVELLETFAKFAGVWIHHASLLDFTIKAGRAATKLSMGITRGPPRRESISRTLTTLQQRSVTELINFALPAGLLDEAKSPDFNIFTAIIHDRSDTEGRLLASRLALDLILSTGLPQQFQCPPQVIAGLIVGLRDKYRPVKYHNWFHATDVLQTVYTFLFHGGVFTALQPLDIFTLLITTLAHDVDHMGVNNSFHLKTDSPLGILSSASGTQSVLEVHHCNVTIEMLACEPMNVFCGLPTDQSAAAYRLLIDCILATDMAKHKDLLDQVAAFAPPYNVDDSTHRRLACIMLMKMADISNVTKPFPVSKLWAKAVTEEFFAQGDKEKEKGIAVLPMFDRNANIELAKGQLGFIDFVTKNFFGTVTSTLLPQLRWAYDRMMENRQLWEAERSSNI